MIIPADDKWFSNLAVAHIVTEHIKGPKRQDPRNIKLLKARLPQLGATELAPCPEDLPVGSALNKPREKYDITCFSIDVMPTIANDIWKST